MIEHVNPTNYSNCSFCEVLKNANSKEKQNQSFRKACADLQAQLQQARAENKIICEAVLNNSKVMIKTPELPNSEVIRFLQDQIIEWQKITTSKAESNSELYNQKREVERIANQLEAENAALRAATIESPKEKEAIKAAESLLKHYKNWGCGHYNAGVCAECYHSLFKELEILKTDNAELLDWLKTFELDFQQWDSGKLNADEIITDISLATRDLINAPHPGASLLKELEALRAVRDAAENLSAANVFCNSTMTETCVGCVFKALCDAITAVKGAD